jgi:hypothetical protein
MTDPAFHSSVPPLACRRQGKSIHIRSLVVAALLVPFAVTPALAQNQRTIAVPGSAAWKHAQTRLVLPPTITGIARDAVVDNSASEIDVIAEYGGGGATTVTFYLFRPALTSVPVWFDRSEAQIMVRDIYANPTAQGPVLAFARPAAVPRRECAASMCQAAASTNRPRLR